MIKQQQKNDQIHFVFIKNEC